MRIGELASLVEILRELDADLARQEADLRQRRARLAELLRQAEAGGQPSEQAPVSPELAGLFGRMAHVAAERPGPEPAMAAKDRDLMALLETAAPALDTGARGTGWLGVLTRTLNSDPGAVERAYAESARQAVRFPDGDLEETGFGTAFYADFAPAQAAAIRCAIDLMKESTL